MGKVSEMEQDTLKALLKMIIYQTERNQLTSIEDIIQSMLPELEKFPSVQEL